jgi:hypothetical protein
MFRRTSTATASMVALGCAVIALLTAAPDAALAQGNPTMSNLIPESESATLHARIVAIDSATRAVTLAGVSGEQVTLTAGPAVRLEMLKVGDRVNARYYRSVAFAVKPPSGGTGTPVSDDQIAQIIARPAQAPGGVGVSVIKISGTVVGVDAAAHRIDIVNPSGGGIYTIDVTDPSRAAMLGSLKVGDTITAVISQALAVSIEPAPKSFF